MRDADRLFERRLDHTLDDPWRSGERAERADAVGGDATGAEPAPHLTFDLLLADTLHEMAAHDEAPPAEPDAVDRLRDEALVALRTRGAAGLGRPFHHAYRRPLGSSVPPFHPPRLDVRS
ncbi:MAG TPA: hypothetical protein PKE51_02570 [Gemmatimonadaceae bacterium]|nr:hypothetical protein [Gemmatimonadaceae bacterium]